MQELNSTYHKYYVECIVYFIGESYSGSIAVSKTVHGGSNPSSPVQEANYQYTHLVVGFFYIEINEKQYLNVSGQTPQKMHCIFFQLFFRSFKTFREFKV